MKVSLIATVLNEGESINKLMLSLLQQSRQADEIIIVDGGSTDNTVNIIQSYEDRLPLKVVIEPGCNISRGRNVAIQASTGDVIVATDAGVSLNSEWLENIVKPFVDDSVVDMVGGFFHADPHNLFEMAMGATVLPLVDEINPATFLPSSRSVAFDKSLSKDAGGYPEWLDYCEDLVFDMRMLAKAKKFVFAPKAHVAFRPRGSLKSFYKQYYLYARGDGKANLWRKRHIIRYLTYLVGIPLIFLLGLWIHPVLWGLYPIGAAIYLYQPYRRLFRLMQDKENLSFTDRLYLFALVPVIRVVGDAAKMHGYPVGLAWRRRNTPPDWRI